MTLKIRTQKIILLVCITFFPAFSHLYAQVENYDEPRRGSVYFGLGYNLQFFGNTSIQVQQDALRNDYSMVGVVGQDHGGNSGFSPLSLSYKFGYYFSYNQISGVEVCLDPLRYYVQDNQNIHFNGTIGGVKIDNNQPFSKSGGNYYYLTGSAFEVKYSTRYGVYRKITHKFSLDILGKAGLGGVTASVQNSLAGYLTPSTGAFAGFDVNLEFGCRWITQRFAYVELVYKHTNYFMSNLPVYQGYSALNPSSEAIVLTAGVFLPVTKGNPIFSPGFLHRRKINHPINMYLFDKEY
jgi:hypothetical protein